MQMTNEEIVREYSSSKDKRKQINILAQLNTCDASQIREILEAAGVEMPKRKYTKAKPEEKPKKAKTESEELPTAIIKSLTMRINEIGAAITLQEAKIEELKQEQKDIKDFLTAHKQL